MSEGLKPCPFRQVNDEGQILCQLIKSADRETTLDICRACPVAQINCQHLRASLEKEVGTTITVRYLGGRTEVWNDHPPVVEFKRAACEEKASPIQSPRDCAGCQLRLPQVTPAGALVTARQYVQARGVARHAAAHPVPAVTAALEAEPVAAAMTPLAPMPPMPAVANPAPVAAAVQAAVAAPAQPVAQAAEPRRKRQPARKPAPAVAAQPAAVPAPARIPMPSAAAAVPAPVGEASEPPQTETKAKIILLQRFLDAQARKKAGEIQDPDTVRDIPSRPAPARSPLVASQPMQEGVEKCVGWTD